MTAVCYNGGTSRGTFCDCLVGFGGIHCQLNRCTTKNNEISFKPLGISFALIVQNSRDMLSPLTKMQKVAPQIVHNLQSTHKKWISSYSFWEFDDKNFDYQTKSPFAEDIINEINEYIDVRRDKDVSKN